MLPEVAESFTESYTGTQLGDHYGAQKPSGAPDPAVPFLMKTKKRTKRTKRKRTAPTNRRTCANRTKTRA
jgi:hypothetical protein